MLSQASKVAKGTGCPQLLRGVGRQVVLEHLVLGALVFKAHRLVYHPGQVLLGRRRAAT